MVGANKYLLNEWTNMHKYFGCLLSSLSFQRKRLLKPGLDKIDYENCYSSRDPEEDIIYIIHVWIMMLRLHTWLPEWESSPCDSFYLIQGQGKHLLTPSPLIIAQ